MCCKTWWLLKQYFSLQAALCTCACVCMWARHLSTITEYEAVPTAYADGVVALIMAAHTASVPAPLLACTAYASQG